MKPNMYQGFYISPYDGDVRWYEVSNGYRCEFCNEVPRTVVHVGSLKACHRCMEEAIQIGNLRTAETGVR